MKKIYSLMAMLAVAAAFAGCADEAVIESSQVTAQGSRLAEVKAYSAGVMTRTALSASGNDFDVLWSAGDKIMIGDYEFTLASGEGTTAAVFTGDIPVDGEYTAYYPSTYRGTAWPEQQYVADNGISGAPMVATATVTDGKIAVMTFENVGGILRYTVKGDKTIKSINVKGYGIDMTLDCGDGVALTAEGTAFNFALPAGTYADAQLTFLTPEGMMATKTASEFTVKKSTVTKATFEADDLDFQMSDNASVGTVSTIWGREAVIVDLGGTLGKVAIATKNVGASADNPNGETYTYYEATASDFLTDGWYVPSMEELYQLSLLCAWDATVPGLIGKNIAALNLPAAGGYTVQQELKPGEEGFYITTRTPDPDSFYGLLFLNVKDSYLATMEAGNRNIAKGSVRPFHKLVGETLPELSFDSPAGSHGIFRGQEAIIVDLGEGFGKYAIATKNVGADKPCDLGTKFQSSELPTATNGWRVPSKEELDALIANNTQTSWNVFNNMPGKQFTIDGAQLFFPAAAEGEQNMYWAKGNGRMTFTESAIETEALTPDAAQSLSAPVRLVYKIYLSASDPEGTIGWIDGREAMVVNIGTYDGVNFGKEAIALKNEGAATLYEEGDLYSFEDAFKKFPKNSEDGWFLPTKEEMKAFYENYKKNIDYSLNYGFAVSINGSELILPYTGRIDGMTGQYLKNYGDFECLTTSSFSNNGFLFLLTSSSKWGSIYDYDSRFSSKYSVRLFHKL